MLQCANVHLDSADRKTFYPSQFYTACLKYISELTTYYMKLSALSQKKSLPDSFLDFLDTQYSVCRTTSQSIRDTIINHMKAFSYNPQDQRNAHESRIKAQLTRLRKKLDEQYMIQHAIVTPQQLHQLS